jgi:hypothetical protein
MIYPFITLNDDTEITHTEYRAENQGKEVAIYIERPSDMGGFHSAVCYLTSYKWEDVKGFTESEIANFHSFIETAAHLIIEFSKDGGFDNAANF